MGSDYDFIAIGDTVTDAFIHLAKSSAHIETDHESGREICLRFGDKIPYDEVYVVPAVGNSANAAVAAARLGLKSALVANIGDDYFGKECLEVFRHEHVGTEFIAINKDHKTNYHYVLWYGDERTILIKHEQYDYHLPDIGNPKWLYVSSAGENSLDFHHEIEHYLDIHPNTKLAFQPGTYQMKFGKEKLARIYQRAEILFCNKEEAQRILGVQEEDIKKLLEMMRKVGPKIVVITDGKAGAYAYDGSTHSTNAQGGERGQTTGLTTSGQMLFMPIYPDPKPPLQRTGAGDAFSSTVAVALALGKNLREALRWGPINSMSVVQQVGARAGLLHRDELEKYLESAPEDYYPKVI